MSFRPDGYLLLWEAETLFGSLGCSSVTRFPMQDAASNLIGRDWFEARNQPSPKYPGLSLLIKQDGSTAYILNEVLRRWAFVSILGTEHLPVYFCRADGQIVRTFSFCETFTPLDRTRFWLQFDPVKASIDDFIAAFMGIKNERFAVLDSAGLVRKLPSKFVWKCQLHALLSSKPDTTRVKPKEFEPFIGCSVCVKSREDLHNAMAMLSIPLNAKYPEIDWSKATQNASMQVSEGKKPLGRPSLQPEIVANFRNRFPHGRGGVSISEVSRVLGYDRKTTRKALQKAGLLDEDKRS